MIKDIPEMFKYERPKVPDDCIHAISPSQIDKFFSLPKIWYNDCYLDKAPEFKGNTGTVTGTICHYIYEMVTKKKEVTREQIDKDLSDYLLVCPNPDVDETQVKMDYPLVSATVVNQYLLAANDKSGVLEVEKQVVAKVMDGIYIAGTCDRIEGDCVVDFKTVATKPNESAIPFGYKIQLLAYAFALRKLGYEINRIRLVYGVKPTKKLSARCYVVTEEIDYMAEKLINDTLRLIGESVLAVKNNPELTYLIFKSMDLKND